MVLSAWPPDASNLESVPWQWTPGAEVGGVVRSVPAMSDITNWGAAVVVTLTVYSTHLLKWKRPWDTGNETAVVPGITELDCSGADWQKQAILTR